MEIFKLNRKMYFIDFPLFHIFFFEFGCSREGCFPFSLFCVFFEFFERRHRYRRIVEASGTVKNVYKNKKNYGKN